MPPSTDPNPRHLEIALHHARILQVRKDAESQILANLERLLDFPLTDDRPASSPSPSDKAEASSLLALFRPSDYDDLIEERHAVHRCGYVLCPRPPRKQDGAGRFKLVGTARGEQFDIVPRRQLELWCSQACAKRAAVVKSQLKEEPVWVRKGDDAVPQITFPEGDPDQPTPLTSEALETVANAPMNLVHTTSKFSGLELETKQSDLPEQLAALALERGETTDRKDIPKTTIRPTLIEKKSVVRPNPPSLNQTTEVEDAFAIMERYRQQMRSNDDKDNPDT